MKIRKVTISRRQKNGDVSKAMVALDEESPLFPFKAAWFRFGFFGRRQKWLSRL